MSEHDRALLAMLPPWALYLVLLVVIAALVLPRLAEASDAAAKLLGPIGRYWRRRGQQRNRQHNAEVQAEARQLAEEIVAKISPAPTPADYEEMRRRLGNMDDRVKELENENGVNRAYIVYDAEWHWEDELAAVGRPDCKPAPRLSIAQFEELYRTGWRPGQPTPT